MAKKFKPTKKNIHQNIRKTKGNSVKTILAKMTTKKDNLLAGMSSLTTKILRFRFKK